MPQFSPHFDVISKKKGLQFSTHSFISVISMGPLKPMDPLLGPIKPTGPILGPLKSMGPGVIVPLAPLRPC